MTQAHGAGVGRFGASGEDVEWAALPGCAVKNCLPIGREAGRAYAAAAECELTIKRRLSRRSREEYFAGKQAYGERDQRAETGDECDREALARCGWKRFCWFRGDGLASIHYYGCA